MKRTTIVFLARDGKIFLARKKRGFGVGYLNGYGGKQHAEDPTIEDAATRELWEEAQIRIKAQDLQKIAVIDFFEGDERLFECHVYFLHEWEGEPVETEEMGKPEAYPLTQLPFDRMWDSDKVWMRLIAEGHKIRARSFYRKGMDVQERFELEPL